MSRFHDPMIAAASEGMISDDHLRWLSYADDELKRLRSRLDLPTPSGYSAGLPNYEVPSSDRARQIRMAVEQSMEGRFSPTDRVAVEQVLDELIAEANASTAKDVKSSPEEAS